jgi:hypothetical protein
MVSLAQSYSDDSNEAAAPEGGGSFAEWTIISLHKLRILIERFYKMTIDLLKTMTQILDVIGIEPGSYPHPSTLKKWLEKIRMNVWRVLLSHSAQLHDPSPDVAVDVTYYHRSPVSKHYFDRTNYCVQTIEAKRSEMFTAQRPEKVATLSYANNSLGGIWASCVP